MSLYLAASSLLAISLRLVQEKAVSTSIKVSKNFNSFFIVKSSQSFLYYNFLYFPRDYFIKYFCRLLVDRVKIIDIPISKTDSALITGETPNLIIE